MNLNNSVPWMEKYRPVQFDDIVLDPINKKILKNIIETSYFPNLLFYGPPGTGKTTTIINLIQSYQEKLNIKNKELVIHLNASDERGIDIIRNQINLFVNSKPLFHKGMKFVILDEVDYMTKNAQQALKYLLQNYSFNVRFCLICNYISRIDEGLQNEFTRLRFNQLPKLDIIDFLDNISKSEKLNLNVYSLQSIQQIYNSDIRSMINFMQTNQDILNEVSISIIGIDVWIDLTNKIINNSNLNIKGYKEIYKFIHSISCKYNIDKKNIIKSYIIYLIKNKKCQMTKDFFYFLENIMHFQDCNNSNYINYTILRLSKFIFHN